MEVSFLGGAREVGRSCLLVEGRRRVLMDCGIKLGEEEEYPLLENNLVQRIDSVVLTHAHLDHSAFLPALYEAGYCGKTIATKPTRDLIQLLLADYLRINKNFSPYAEKDVNALLKKVVITEYEAPAAESIVLHDAGHILGSAMVELREGNRKILYTGDVNTRATRLLEGAKTGLHADTVIIESTYGSPQDILPSLKDAGRQLIESIKKTLDHGGKVLIPTFAIGRGQEILFTLESYLRSRALPRTPIYLDGMIKKALRIYRHNAVYLKREIQLRILSSEDDPFKSKHFLEPKTKTREDVFEEKHAVILATSGMLNAGPVLTYLKHLGPDPKNKIILVGYQVKGTRGRELLEGADELKVDDESVPINLEVDEARFSAHCDHHDLLEFVKSIRGLRKVFIVHGEENKPFDLARSIEEWARRKRKAIKVIVPRLGETHKI